MLKGYKYTLKPTEEQKILLKNHMFTSTQAYNIILSIKKEEYQLNQIRKKNNQKVEYFSAKYIDDKVKKLLKERKLIVNTKVIQQERCRFTQNSMSQIKKIKSGNKDIGNLQYKRYSHISRQSIQTTKDQYNLLDSENPKRKILRLFNNSFEIIWTRDLPSKPTSITISYEADKFYITFNVKEDKIQNIEGLTITSYTNTMKKIGLDMNNQSIDIGKEDFHQRFKIKSLKDKKKIETRIIKLQKKQSKRLEVLKKLNKNKPKEEKKKVGSNFYKTQVKINKLHKKIKNKRDNRIHQMTNNIIKTMFEHNFSHIVVEDLNVKTMTVKTTNKNKIKLLGKEKTKSMKKNILDISYSEFLRILEYKCVQFGIVFSKVDPKYTSKSCSNCGCINNELELKHRIFDCKECGHQLNRDHNATINIKNRIVV